MELFMIGMKNEQISKRLNISKYFIIKTFKSVIKKFNVKNKIQAASIIAKETRDNDINNEFWKYKKQTEETRNFSISIDFKFKFS